MKVVCDTGPLVAGVSRRDRLHGLAAALLETLGAELIVLEVVAAEADALLRGRYGGRPARLLLDALARGGHTPAFMSPGLWRRAIELDSLYADLDLGLVDASVMAYAERHRVPILSFDFRDFRATQSRHGPWDLLLEERDLGLPG